MKINENGVVREMTQEEEAEYLEMTKDDPKAVIDPIDFADERMENHIN